MLVDYDAEIHHTCRWGHFLWELEVGVVRRAAEDVAFFGVQRLNGQHEVDAVAGGRAGCTARRVDGASVKRWRKGWEVERLVCWLDKGPGVSSVF